MSLFTEAAVQTRLKVKKLNRVDLRHQIFCERNFDCCLSHHVFTDRNISSFEGKILSAVAQRLNWSQLFLLGFRISENVNSDRKTRREAARSAT